MANTKPAHCYIRHGARLNLDLDPPLKNNAGIAELVAKLLVRYGQPIFIVTSPYLRCRQTALFMNENLTTKVPIYVNVELSETLVYRKPTKQNKTQYSQVVNGTTRYFPPGQFDDQTRQYGAPLKFEDAKSIKERLYSNMLKFAKYSQTIWFVTHGGIVKNYLELWGIRGIRGVPYLTTTAKLISEAKIELIYPKYIKEFTAK